MSPSSTTILSLLALSLFSTTLAVNHEIEVGPGLTFEPANTIAAADDTLTFRFSSFPHDVASGPFSTPCRPFSSTSPGSFYSGVIASSDTTFVVTVNSTDPIYFYCTVNGHCQGGMVGGVNVPNTQTESLALYLSASEATTSSNTPASVHGGVRGSASDSESDDDSASSSTTASATAAATGSSTSTSSSASTSASTTATTGGNTSGASMLMNSNAGLLLAGLVGVGLWVGVA